MKTQVIFRGFEGFDHLKKYVLDCLENTVGKLDTHSLDEVKVIVDTTHNRRLGHPPEFLCEALMRTRARTFFTKKIDKDFHASVKKCMKALSKTLINSTRAKRDKRRSQDRRQSAYEFNLAAAEVS